MFKLQFLCFFSENPFFLPGNFCTLCSILQVRVHIASLETVHLLLDK